MENSSTGQEQNQQEEQSQTQQAQPVDISELVKTILQNIPQQQALTPDAIAAAVRASNSNGHKHQSHNLTIDEMKEVKRKQMDGSVKMIPANKIAKYLIPEHEKHLMHFSTERVRFDAESGDKLSKPSYHAMMKEDFIRMSKSVKEKGEKINPENAFNGMKVIIYHDVREGAEISASKEGTAAPTLMEMLEHMDEKGVRKIYFQVFQEEALPSDSVSVMKGLIQEKIESSEIVE